MTKHSTDGKHRLPNSRFTRFTASVLRLFYHRRVSGTENIDPEVPAVFTCNHGRVSGPVTAVCFLPIRFRPWINGCMLNREEATATMMRTFRDRFTFLGPKAKRRILRWVSGFICHLLNSFEPIPVYKGMPRESAGTISLSVDALEQGDNLLIFPEKPRDRYDEESYKDFNTGFAALGRAYYERTGKCLGFHPCWSDPKSRDFRIGAPVYFDPANGPKEEKIRIASELRARMDELRLLCKR